MTRDYSQLFPDAAPTPRPLSTLRQLGWQPFFAAQTSIDEMAAHPPVRVVAQHRSGMEATGEAITATLPPQAEATVGDWLLFDRDDPARSRLLDRRSLFQRRAPGTTREHQRIAANVDTAFIVSSCNADFNIARLERYVSLVFEAEVEAVILLTKADLADADGFVADAAAISERVLVLALDARGTEPAVTLAPWCSPGRTLAFLGSSGVGKSTLVNALSGKPVMATGGIREDDAKGRHTTSHRALHILPGGFCVLDTPGMRELQMFGTEAGIAGVFEDIEALAAACRFNDCAHETEPGCAVRAALAQGEIDAPRLARWQKLKREDAFNSATLSERRAQGKAFGKMVRRVIREKRER
ncbi:ribosome small subunit-dependent GTPase A [Algicella marina]|uniref:Small ribosomal subunit biogenesis GTPase RsgA n=1 Tax=Algicella marina TaxID=2683284 RepID=A0A6P1T1V2_9RHOB|nr:ribosome small subunit-dependent GTPase A [Algicella marina]QHQ35957.1 ribosome small subunit-dependent GTPase A [Algicella marina]